MVYNILFSKKCYKAKKTKTKKVKSIQDYKEALSKSREMKINGGKINFKKENIILQGII